MRSARKELRELEAQMSRNAAEVYAKFQAAKDEDTAYALMQELAEMNRSLEVRKAIILSLPLAIKAAALGIEIPDEHGWWNQNGGMNISLTDKGRTKVKKMIRQERLSTAEQWIKVITPVLTALTGLLGLLVALLSIAIRR